MILFAVDADPATASAARDLGETFGLPILLALFALAGTVLGVLMGQWAAERQRRRDGYAAAVRTLIAWHEYPYRIRRRTDDTAATLQRLAEHGHELQEQLRYHQTWVTSESRGIGALYQAASSKVMAACAEPCRDAWDSPPATTPGAMKLNGWGPPGLDAQIAALQGAIGNRFGWRRALAVNMWRAPQLP